MRKNATPAPSRARLVVPPKNATPVEKPSDPRGKNRHFPKNVIHSKFNLEKINYAYKKALSLKFKNKIKNLKNPYFQKDTSIKVANIIFKLLNKYAN